MARRGEISRRRSAWQVVIAVTDAKTWIVTGYLLSTSVSGAFWATVIVASVTVGVGSAMLWVGLLLLAALPLVWRSGARLERRFVSGVFDVSLPSPYRSSPAKGLFVRAQTVIGDPATWKDLAYLVALYPLGVTWSVIVIGAWTYSLGVAAAPLYYRAVPDAFDWLGLNKFGLHIDTMGGALIAFIVGLALTIPAAQIVRGVGFLHQSIAAALLGVSSTQRLAAETARLRTSRDETVVGALEERRRIERDLHDGVQQRLTSIAVDLGIARSKLPRSTDGTHDSTAQLVELIDSAHANTKTAITELRDLTRGLYPAILVDRGLDPALSSLTAHVPVPVDVVVDLPMRPPLPVEAAAYFVVSEALTNTTKHAGADNVWVRTHSTDRHLFVEVGDNGNGGATAEAGGGLAGLDARVRALDGVLTVSSPADGPTVVAARIPCTL